MRFSLCMIAALMACSAGAPGPGIDVSRALGHVDALVKLGPHPGESPQAKAAAGYVEGQLQAMGARVERLPVGTVELAPIEVLGVRRRGPRTQVTTDPDLIVRFGPATGRAVLVMAHYDTVAKSPGAVDDSASVAVVLELARVLASAPPAEPVMLAFTANEEIGLVGAEALAHSRGSEVGFAVALDLIGGSGDLSLNGASELIGRAEMAWLAAAADRAGVIVRAPLPHRVVSRAWPQAERADHGPFTRRGIAAFHLYNRGQDGEQIDLAYHSARDTADRIDRGSLDEIGRLLRALIAVPPPAHDGDGFWLPVAVNTVVPRWLVVGLEVALAALALGFLTGLRGARARGGLGLVVGAVCAGLALAFTMVVERLLAGDHPAPWLHGPGTALVAELAVFAGALGTLVVAVRRFSPWVGDRRYLAVAIAVPLAMGLGCLGVGAAELAWIWLMPAAGLAVAPRLGRLGLVAIALSVLPGVLVLDPRVLREAAWNGFWPIGVPLAVWVAGFAVSPIAAVAWWLRKSRPAGPLGTLLQPLGAALAIVVGGAVLLRTDPPCNPQQFNEFSLACETLRKMR